MMAAVPPSSDAYGWTGGALASAEPWVVGALASLVLAWLVWGPRGRNSAAIMILFRGALSRLRTHFERPQLVTWDALHEITVWVGPDGRYHVQWHGAADRPGDLAQVAQHLFAAAQCIAAQAGLVVVAEPPRVNGHVLAEQGGTP